MRTLARLFCARTSWQGRPAYRLGNDVVEMIVLTGGGHIAEFRFRNTSGNCSENPLWTPPWKTIDPHRFNESSDAGRYGSRREGQLLSGLAGHNICLDYFGPASEEEVASGRSFHGEVPNSQWRKLSHYSRSDRVELALATNLPFAGLKFNRSLKILHGESLIRFSETVKNPKRSDHYFQWAEHVTLGPPFLTPKESYVVIPAGTGMTDPGGYDEGRTLLLNGRKFRWPMAPSVAGRTIDLSRPFPIPGKGFVTTQLLSRKRDIAFIAGVNERMGLMIGYAFCRHDFPWVAVWDENRAIRAKPWNGRTQARGLEFSNSPFPAGRHAAISQGNLFGVPTICRLAARSQKTVNYCSFLASLPENFGIVRDILVLPNELKILGEGRRSLLLNALDVGSFLTQSIGGLACH